MSQPQPPDEPTSPPADARPGDTWSLDPPAGPTSSAHGTPVPPPPGEGPLPVIQAEMTDPGGSAPTPPRRGLKIAGIAFAVILILAGAAGAAAFLMLRGSGEVILDKVPADADVVVTAYLDPAASQKVNLLRMASKFPALGDQDHLRQQLNDGLDQILADVGMSHEDVGWVGSEVGLYVDVRSASDTSYAFLLATDDEAAARESLLKFRQGLEGQGTTFHVDDHDGVEVTVPSSSDEPATAIVDGVVVLGSNEDAVNATIDTAHGGATISDDPAFQRVTGALPEAKLGVAFVDAAQLADTFGDQLAAAGVTTGITSLSALDGIGVAVSAEPEGLAVDTVMLYDDAKLSDAQRQTLSATDHPNALLDLVPADALGMYVVEHLDTSIADSIDQITRDQPAAAQQLERLGVTGANGLLSQLTGDVAVEATTQSGSTPYGGALMVGTDDPGATATWLDRTIQQIPLGGTTVEPTANGGYRLIHHPVRWETEQHAGVTITYASSGASVPLAYAVVGEVAIVGTSLEQVEGVIDAKGAGGSISSDPGFTASTASVPTSDGVFYLDVPALVDVIRAQLPPDAAESFDNEIGKNLAPIEAVVAGTENRPDEQRARLFVRIP